MARKIKDVCVKTGEYRSNDGETRGRYQNVGALIQSDDGSQYIMLKKWFNPAGIPDKQGSDSILLSFFEPKSDNATTPQSYNATTPQSYNATTPQSYNATTPQSYNNTTPQAVGRDVPF
jgi:hypothetical protein